MKISIKRTDNDYRMEAINDTGNVLLMDGSESIGGHNSGMRPMQLLLAAIGGCSAIDIISILKKQRQEISSFACDVDGDSVKNGEHSVYETIDIVFRIEGKIDPEKALRAAELSFTKYCSVSKALEYSSLIRYKVELNGKMLE